MLGSIESLTDTTPLIFSRYVANFTLAFIRASLVGALSVLAKTVFIKTLVYILKINKQNLDAYTAIQNQLTQIQTFKESKKFPIKTILK